MGPSGAGGLPVLLRPRSPGAQECTSEGGWLWVGSEVLCPSGGALARPDATISRCKSLPF